MTPNQQNAMRRLSAYKGQTVKVLTSEYTNGVNPEFLAESIGYIKSQTLRGLEKQGLIKIDCAYWRGATVTVF